MLDKLVEEAELSCQDIFKEIDNTEAYFSKLILDAFQEENINESHFNMTTGYGYNDLGRDAIEKVFAPTSRGDVFSTISQ